MKKIRDSLTAKIFLMTACLLLLVSGITYACVSEFLPSTYQNELEENLQKMSEELKEELEQYASVEEAENLLEVFAASNQANVTILDSSGTQLFPKEDVSMGDYVSEDTTEEGEDREARTVTEATEQSQDSTVIETVDTEAADSALSYEITDSLGTAGAVRSAVKGYQVKIGQESYTMLVSGTMEAVSQTMKILRDILPMITGVIAAVALICALCASFYLTKPIMRLSRISRKMASLQFKEKCPEKRTDEIGILAKSLNELSGNLSVSLESLKEANRQLKSDMEKEREEERKRTAFFAAASHELKTPVTILKGHLGGMIQNVGEYKNRDKYLKRSYEVTETMEQMVQEILSISRMESGAWEPRKTQTDLAELVRLQIAEILELMESKNMELQVQVPEHLFLQADQPMMEKVIRNLLVNAVRYSPEEAEIRIYMQEQQQMVLFYVENTGVHIQEENLSRLFDAFYRVENSRNRKSGGSGLGLYIVRMIVEQHGGVCGAENSKAGVRVWFRISKNT